MAPSPLRGPRACRPTAAPFFASLLVGLLALGADGCANRGMQAPVEIEDGGFGTGGAVGTGGRSGTGGLTGTGGAATGGTTGTGG
ncbi:MAG TPA: hypothetical protein VHO06_10630, partial [Polyangia bacterium]|nr:hypothetical protein [Polyangia bacterium]